MKKYIAIGCAIFFMGTPHVSGFDNEDVQFWFADKFSKSINEKLNFALEQDLRYGSSGEDLYYVHTDFTLKYKLSSRFGLGFKYREVFEEKSSVWTNEHRPQVELTVKQPLGERITFSARVRLDYRMKESGNTFRNRDLFSIKSNRSFTTLKLAPYAALEIFYDLEENELNRTRTYLGFELKNIRIVKPTIFYMRQSSLKSGDWKNYNIIGIKISY